MQANDVQDACRLLFSTTSAASRHDFRLCARTLLTAHPIGGAETLAGELHLALLNAPRDDPIQAQRTYQRHALGLTVDFPVLTRPLWEIAFMLPTTGRFAVDESGRCLAYDLHQWLESHVVTAPRSVIEAVTRVVIEHCICESASPWRHCVLVSLLFHLTSTQRERAVQEVCGQVSKIQPHEAQGLLHRTTAVTRALLACAAVDGDELVSYSALLGASIQRSPGNASRTAGGGASLLVKTHTHAAGTDKCRSAAVSCLSALDAVGQALLLDEATIDDDALRHRATTLLGPSRPCDCSSCQNRQGTAHQSSSSSGFCLQPLYSLCYRTADPLSRDVCTGDYAAHDLQHSKRAVGRKQSTAAQESSEEAPRKRTRAPSMTSLSGWATMPLDILHSVMSYLSDDAALVDSMGCTCKGWREPVMEWRGWKAYFTERWALVSQAQCMEVKLACAPLLPPFVRCTCSTSETGRTGFASSVAARRPIVDRSHNWRGIAVARLRAEELAAASTRKAGVIGAQLLTKSGSSSMLLASPTAPSATAATGKKTSKPASAQVAHRVSLRWKNARSSRTASGSGSSTPVVPPSEDGRTGEWVPCVCDVCTCAALLPTLAAARAHLKEHHGLDRQVEWQRGASKATAGQAAGRKGANKGRQQTNQSGEQAQDTAASTTAQVPWWYIPAKAS